MRGDSPAQQACDFASSLSSLRDHRERDIATFDEVSRSFRLSPALARARVAHGDRREAGGIIHSPRLQRGYVLSGPAPESERSVNSCTQPRRALSCVTRLSQTPTARRDVGGFRASRTGCASLASYASARRGWTPTGSAFCRFRHRRGRPGARVSRGRWNAA